MQSPRVLVWRMLLTFARTTDREHKGHTIMKEITPLPTMKLR